MQPKPFTWRLRRKVTIGTLVFCAVVFVWILAMGADTELNRLAIEIIGIVASGVIAVYTGAKTIFNLKNRQGGGEQ